MFKKLFQFEVFYQLKQRAFPIFALLFLALGVFVGKQGHAPAGVDFNSVYQVYFYTNIFTLGSVFITMFFAISGMLRDKQHHMEHLIYSTSIKKNQFFWSRFLGIFTFSVLAFTPYLIGFALGVSFSNLDPERVGAFSLMTYLQPWLYMVLPNIFICSSLIFAVSTLTKNNTATYASAVFIYMLYFVSAIFLNSPLIAQSVPASPESMAIAALADPFGIAAFFEQTQYWTPFQKNTELLSFSGLFMGNRLLWILGSVGMLLLTYAVFSFRTLSKKVKKAPKVEKETKEIIAYQPIEGVYSLKAKGRAFVSLIKIELSGVFKSLPFLAVLIMWSFIVFSEIYSTVVGGGNYNDSLYPFTNLLIELMTNPLSVFSHILMVFYSGELLWKERGLNFNTIIDATPVTNTVFFLSKFITLLLLPSILILSGIAICIGFQAFLGYTNFELDLYASLFYFQGIPLLVFCMIAMLVHSLVKNKYMGMGIFGAIIILSMKASFLGLEHPLTSIGFLPNPSYNNMNGFSGITKLFHHLSLYWLAFGGMLSLITFKLWQRGIIASVRYQLKTLKSNWNKGQVFAFAVLAMVFMGAASMVYYNNNILMTYETSSDNLDSREQYERKFKQYQDLERLYPIAIKTEIGLFPSEEMYTVKADYILKNKSKHPISQVFLTERVPLQSISIEQAELIEHDTIFGTYLFEFKNAIAPEQTLKYTFETKKVLKGYETDRTIIQNGSYITHRNFDPFHYGSGMEITDPMERQKRNLPKRLEEIETDSHIAIEDNRMGKINFETIISTQKDQVALSSGTLLKEWTKEDRNYYHFKSKTKIVPTMAYFSADYATKKTNYKGIAIANYYHPAHEFNIEQIETSIKNTLDYCIENFGPYAFDAIRFAEIPGHWSFGGFAHPGLVSMVEDRLYLVDNTDKDAFNLVAKRTIHEVAHQWWGHTLTPKVIDGGAIFVEGFAKYTEAVIMEQVYGKGAVFQLSETANRRYFRGRTFASTPEPGLYLEDDQDYLAYGKSLTVLLALRDLIGEKQVNSILRNLTDTYRDEEEFKVTALDFIEELYAASPAKYHGLVDDWLKKVITYDLGIKESSYTALADGTFEVTVKVKAKRFETVASGETQEIGINEPVRIGIFTEHPSLVKEEDAILHYEMQQINKEASELKLIVKERPTFIAIDPYGTRSDENRVDNILRLDPYEGV